mmetsp:Transcript_18969/g.52198  ORF Transcript_18969/g.52198 Transcript_18969/m.52198 type:complete len:250 (+) Transcript_18969:1-750(+)
MDSMSVRDAVLVLAVIACASAVPNEEMAAAPKKALVECGKLSATYCDLQFGCDLDSDNVCFFNGALQTADVNCTQTIISAGALVAAVLDSAVSIVEILNQHVMPNTTAIMDILENSPHKYDQAIKTHNQSLIQHNTAVLLLRQYSDELDTLAKACSAIVPPPPPACPALIASAQAKVAHANASVASASMQVSRAKAVVDTAEPVARAAAAKAEAMVYWDQVEAACHEPWGAGRDSDPELFDHVMRMVLG